MPRPLRLGRLGLRPLCLAVMLLGLAGCAGDERPPGDTAPAVIAKVHVELVEGEGLDTPIDLVSPPTDPGRLLLVDQAGTVRRLTDGGLADEPPFLDLTDRIVPLDRSTDDERGLLGVAFSPAYATDGLVYTFRTAPLAGRDWSHRNVLSRFRVDDTGARVDPESEEVLWSLPQQERSHAAGQLHFDDRGRLLVFVGDGQLVGSAQDPGSQFGKVLAFDVTDPGSEPEVLASGMRHPWRLSFDAPTGHLLFAEPNFITQNQEVNVFVEGANYGWQTAIMPPCYGIDDDTPAEECVTGPEGQQLEPPVAEYGPEGGLIVTGAHIYRGSEVPMLDERLVVADWGVTSTGSARGGRLLVSAPVGEPPHRPVPVTVEGLRERLEWFWSLARDDGTGELYLMTLERRAPGNGAVYRIVGAE